MFRYSLRDLLIITAIVAAALKIGGYLAEPIASVTNGWQNKSVAMDTSAIAPEYPR